MQYYEEVKDKIFRLRDEGWDLKKIRDEVLGREQAMTYIPQGEFSKLNLVKGFLGS